MLLRAKRENKIVFSIYNYVHIDKYVYILDMQLGNLYRVADHVNKLNVKDTMWECWMPAGGWARSAAAAGVSTCRHCPTPEAADALQQWQNSSHLSLWATQSSAQQTHRKWDQSQNPVSRCTECSTSSVSLIHSFLEVVRGGQGDLVHVANQLLAACLHAVQPNDFIWNSNNGSNCYPSG